MSLRLTSIGFVPEDTARVARAAFPKGSAWLLLRDELGTIFTDAAFASLFPRRGQPAEAPWRLALVTLLQYAENLSDRQAANAVRSRIDWKYLLGLELTDAGFDNSVLSEFRSRLLAGGAEEQLLQCLLQRCKEKRLLRARGRQRTDSTHVLSRVRTLNRLEGVGETLRAALNVLALAHPEWSRSHAPPEWVERYGTRVDDYNLPKGDAARRAYAEVIGRDGHHLLDLLSAADAPAGLRMLPAVEVLRQVWVQQFYRVEESVRWRTAEEGIPLASIFINSPYDVESRYARKRSTTWTGYKVHLTEVCEEAAPHLITHVQTTIAPATDASALESVHQALQEKEVLPSRHLVDASYVDAQTLVRSQGTYQVDLLGPAPGDGRWQAKAGKGFDAAHFTLDWDTKKAICPAGKQSVEWGSARDGGGHPVVRIKFARRDCGSCAHRSDCTRSAHAPRAILVREKDEYLALQAARAREAEADFRTEYGRRAGVEGTLSQGVRAFHLRQARYIGLAKTHLQHVATAGAINLVRLAAWLMGEEPAKTRQSTFVRLMAQPGYA
jgi:transposase